MQIKAFITHKKAETFADCQDRFCINPATKSIAVSDGLSESIFQKIWADILVKQYVALTDWIPDLPSVRELSQTWFNMVNVFISEEEKNGANPWRAKNSIYVEQRSAGATILGLRCNGTKWTCHALGDSCLISVKDYRIQQIVPIHDSFDNYPDYYDSNSGKEGKGVLKSFEGTLNAGDCLLLVTDPFSDYLSKFKGTGVDVELLKGLLSITNHDEFQTLVDKWRNDGMHNDDSTLVIVQDDGSTDFNLVANAIDDIDFLIQNQNMANSTTVDDSRKDDKMLQKICDDIRSLLLKELYNTKANKNNKGKGRSIIGGLSKKKMDFLVCKIIKIIESWTKLR